MSAFTAAGAAVWAADQHQIAEPGAGVVCRYGDLGDEEFVRALAAECDSNVGHLDALVHCAGLFSVGGLADCDLATWEKSLRTNVTAGFLLLKHLHPLLTRSSQASVSFIGSVAGMTGGEACGPAYAASKAGLHTLAKWAARHLAKDGIRVNVIAPGPLDTSMTSNLDLQASRVPLGRLGQAEDIAAAALYLASPAGQWVTGQVFSPNGGTHIS